MILLFCLFIIAVFLHGIIAGTSFDVAIVKLPTRKRIGYIAYANFARNNDLGNGIIVYPLLGISALLITFITTALAYFYKQSINIIIILSIASFLTIANSLCTLMAAPIMLSLKTTKNDEIILKKKLDKFAFWHLFRTIFQILTFITWLWALVLILK